LNSAAYAEDWETVRRWGGAESVERSAEQGEIARFWSDFSYTVTPPGHWHEIAATLVDRRGWSLLEEARMFALLGLAQADTGIAVWEAKYRYNFWRPVTAIQRADEDGNPATQLDATWLPLLATPSFPEHVSGHSAFSGASAAVLEAVMGTDAVGPFSATSDTLPGVRRTFGSVRQCADEIGLSRIYGGIHFPSANREGKAAGRRIGEFVSANFLLPHDRLPFLRIEAPAGGSPTLRVHGRWDRVCIVEASGDLVHWEAVATNAPVAGGWEIGLPRNETGGATFFRVRQ
jgi:hypothetical protein